jgi:DNA mismatch repair ATPase MutS
MYRERDFDMRREPPVHAQTLTEDLDLDTLLGAMALGDRYLYDVARVALFCSVDEQQAIVYRQDVLRDCLEHPDLTRALYGLTVEALEAEKRAYFGFLHTSRYPDSTMHGAVAALGVFAELLTRLRQITDEHAHEFSSEGFTAFFAMIKTELDDEYLHTVKEHLSELSGHDVRASARLGQGANGVDYRLHRSPARGLVKRIASLASRSQYTYRIADRDEQGARTLGELRGRALNEVANTAAQSGEHIRDFFALLRAELGFYIGALQLHAQLTAKGEPTSFPTPLPGGQRTLIAGGLYEPCLALRIDGRVVGNDVNGKDKPLAVITGANQGGKSTFLRSAGIAQLMMQCGLFVAAESLTANVCVGVFTHFKREEDTSMESGKLDEELARMSEIADAVKPNSLVLFNESFAATNEREGSQIARQIIAALIDSDSRVLFVTHMYDLAHRLQGEQRARALFLRAERQSDRTRTFKLLEAEPLPTSYGPDIYRRIFGESPAHPRRSHRRFATALPAGRAWPTSPEPEQPMR